MGWQSQLPARVRLFDIGLALGAIATAVAGWAATGPLDWRGIVFFALFYAASLLLGITQSNTLPFNLAVVPVSAAALALGLAGALWVIALGALAAAALWYVQRRTRLAKRPAAACWPQMAIASSGIYAVAALAAAGAYRLAGGSLPLDDLHLSTLPPMAAAGAALLLAALGVIALRLALLRPGLPPPRAWIAPLLLAHLLPLPIGMLLGVAYAPHADHPLVYLMLMAGIISGAALLHSTSRTRRALEQRVNELAALNLVGRAITADFSTDALFEAIYQQITQACDASLFSIALYDAAQGRLTFPFVVQAGRRVNWDDRPVGNGVTEHVIATRRTLLLDGDVRARLQALERAMPGALPACYLGVPLLAGHEVLGVLAVQHDTLPDAYGDAEQKLLESIAVQAAVALRNTRLFEETQTVTAELHELVETSREFTATLDVDALASSIVQRLYNATPARHVSLYTWDAERQTPRVLAHLPATSSALAEWLVGARPGALAPTVTAPQTITLALPGADGDETHHAEVLPLIVREDAVGAVVLWDQDEQAALLGENRLAEGIVNQAAVALQNAQTYTQADASLRERVIELSAIEVISRHMSATLDLETIINDVLAAAMSAIDAELGCCALVLNHAQFMIVALLEQNGAKMPLPIVRPIDQGVIGRVLRTRERAVVADVHTDPEYVNFFPGLRADPHSKLCVPIVREDRAIGVLNFEDTRTDAFTESHARFVQTLAEHAAIAIENAQLFTDRQRQIETLLSLRRLSTALLGAARLEPVVETIVQHAQEITNAACVRLYLVEPNGTLRGIAPHDDCAVPGRYAEQTARSGEAFYSVDLAALPAYRAFVPLKDFEAHVCVPIQRAGRVLGVLTAQITDSRFYAAHEMQALEVLANQAAVAIESISLNAEVRAGRDQLQAILDSTREGMLLFDREGHLLRANPAAEEMLGQSLAPFLGRSFVDWLRATRREALEQRTGHTLPQLRRYLLDVTHDPHRTIQRQFVQPGADSPHYIEEIGSPVLDIQGERVIGWLLVWRDITEERKLHDLRQEINSMIVHDLRSPLTAIISSLTMLQDLLDETEIDRRTMREIVQIAKLSSDNMLRLVESLLDIARLEQNRVSLDLMPCALHDVVNQACTAVLSIALEAEIALDNAVTADLPLVQIDREQIQRVLVNLLDNALRHTPSDGQVRVSAATDAERGALRISVCDSGPGVPPDARSMIFEKFAQLDQQSLRGHKGSGLGLTYCKLVVEAHGGTIWVDEAPLGGAAFHLTLPILPEEPSLDVPLSPTGMDRQPIF